jgi:TFIIH basal transcription factor complex TTD-A subunit
VSPRHIANTRAIMPRAQAGQEQPWAIELEGVLISSGVLVECDASIKAIIVKINAEDQNAYIIEDIDDEHVLIQASKYAQLKARLNAVCLYLPARKHLLLTRLMHLQTLKDTVREPEESESE